MKSRTILVTGGAGMIGSHLVQRLLREGWDVTVVDNLWRGKLEYLDFPDVRFDAASRFFNLDLREPGALEKLPGKYDYIVHLADVVAGVDFVFANQGLIFRENLLINSHVLAGTRKLKPRGFLYVGTACSFPQGLQTGPDARPLREEDQYPADPESAYGWSKLMGEYESRLMEKETGIPVCILVLHNVYGPHCDVGPRSQVIPSLINRALRHPREPFIVWGSGRQGRAFVYVDDIVEAIVQGLDRGWGHGPIQIGPPQCLTIREIAEAIVAVSGKDISIEYDLSKPEGDKGRCADHSLATRLLGWEPRVSIKEGLSRTYHWIEKQTASAKT